MLLLLLLLLQLTVSGGQLAELLGGRQEWRTADSGQRTADSGHSRHMHVYSGIKWGLCVCVCFLGSY